MTALFSYVTDSAYTIVFTDQSYINPQVWHWNFGDGETAVDQHPQHTYDTSGTYSVCLEVSNGFSSDTACQDIILTGYTSTSTGHQNQTPVISPNPFSSFIDFTPPAGREIYEIRITTIQGHPIVNVEMSCPCRIMTAAFPAGVYLYQIRMDRGEMMTGKAVKI